MKNIFNKIVDLFPLIVVLVLAWIVVAQFIDARHELEQSRAACYAQIGKEACEDVR